MVEPTGSAFMITDMDFSKSGFSLASDKNFVDDKSLMFSEENSIIDNQTKLKKKLDEYLSLEIHKRANKYMNSRNLKYLEFQGTQKSI